MVNAPDHMTVNRELTKKGWLVFDEPVKPLADYLSEKGTAPLASVTKRMLELLCKQPGECFEVSFYLGSAELDITRKERSEISLALRSFLHLPDNFSGKTACTVTDDYGFTRDSGNRAELFGRIQNI